MKLSAAGLAAIREHESLRLKAYPDPGSSNGLPVTVGFGATRRMDGGPWQLGDVITEAEAVELLERDTQEAQDAVNKLVEVPLRQGQFDALVSFTMNVGQGAFSDSTLLRLLNSGDYHGAEMQFQRWNLNDGQVMAGLTKRRAAEAAMFAGAAPITESKPTWEAPMPAPIIAALFPALLQAIPGLIRTFGSEGQVTDRNAKAAEAVLEIVQAATGTPNAQAAVEAVQRDPAALAAATEALDREHWFEATEAGGGGIAGAREFNVAASAEPFRMPALWISIALLLPFYCVVAAVLFMPGWSAEIRIQVVTAVLATVGMVAAFWLGSSFGSQKKDNALTRTIGG
jgi:lysozyme